MVAIPEELLRRSAAAKAAATGRPIDEVLAEMRAAVGETASEPVPEVAPAEPTSEHPTALPEDLLRREAAARARILGVSEEDAVAEMRGEKELVIPASPKGEKPEVVEAPTEVAEPLEDVPAEPTEAPAPQAEPDRPAVALVGADGAIDYAPAAEVLGMPESLLKRSVEAKAKAKGLEPLEVLAEMTGQDPGTAAQAEPVPAAAAEPEPAPVAPAASPAAAGPLDYAAASDALGMPEALLKRSVEAKAKAKGVDPAVVLAEMTGGAVPAAPAAAAPAAPAAPAAAAAGEPDWAAAASAAGMPEKLFRRSVEAKAKAKGVDPAVVLAEMTGGAVPAAPAASAAPAAAAAGEPDWAAAASAAGMSEKLFRRSVEAKAKAKGVEPAVMLAEMTGVPVAEPAPAAAAPAPASTPTRPAPTAVPTPAVAAARPAAAAERPGVLSVVKSKAMQQVTSEQPDKVNVWPHLLLIEFVALLAVLSLLIVMSVVIQAPLLEAANANVTPNPAKAPWYFLGLQELLTYFDPQIAGVTVPTIVGLIGFMAIPYIDRNPSNKPTDRKFAIFMYTFFIMGAATLTIIGVLFRGRGFNFTYPWSDGVFFDDLKDWIDFE